MNKFFELVLLGLGFGGIYALAALGLALVFRTTLVVNFAYGAMATVVTLMLWTLFKGAGLPLVVAWAAALIVGLAVGAVSEIVFLRRVERAPVIIQIVLTLGLLLLIEGLVGAIWGYQPKSIPKVLTGSPLRAGSFSVDPNSAFIVVLTLVVGAALYAVYRFTRMGLAMRAVAEDREVATLMGVRARRYVTASWAIGVLVTGLAAVLVAPSTGIEPNYMDQITVFAFAAAVLGGFGSLVGAVVGGFILGIGSDLIAGYLNPNLQLTLVFALIVVVLYVRPEGLFGEPDRARL